MTRDPQRLDVPTLLAAPDDNKHLPMADPSLSPPIKAPNAQNLIALAQAQDIIASRLARFESVDALIHDLEKNSSKTAVYPIFQKVLLLTLKEIIFYKKFNICIE